MQRLIAVAQESVGDSREDVALRWRELTAGFQDRKLGDGVLKLVEDRCEFSSENAEQSETLRGEVFALATERRRLSSFERDDILRTVGEKYELSSEQVDAALFADLRGADRLTRAPNIKPELILGSYVFAQQQAVLLRAVSLEARLHCKDPARYRLIFQKLKFRRLLFEVEALDGAFRVRIDGPYSLFESVTKYGLALALSLPVFLACDELELVADVRWGAAREALKFFIRKGDIAAVSLDEKAGAGSDTSAEADSPSSELDRLVDAFNHLGSAWKIERAPQILNLPGVGVCVPDLLFRHSVSGERIFFELMGYWSRDAVFRRVELVERGLGVKLLFAVNQKLRVSEGVANLEEGAALYVFKRTLNARAIFEKLEALAGAASQAPGLSPGVSSQGSAIASKKATTPSRWPRST